MKGLGYVIVLAGCLLALVSQEVQARSYLGEADAGSLLWERSLELWVCEVRRTYSYQKCMEVPCMYIKC